MSHLEAFPDNIIHLIGQRPINTLTVSGWSIVFNGVSGNFQINLSHLADLVFKKSHVDSDMVFNMSHLRIQYVPHTGTDSSYSPVHQLIVKENENLISIDKPSSHSIIIYAPVEKERMSWWKDYRRMKRPGTALSMMDDWIRREGRCCHPFVKGHFIRRWESPSCG